MLSVVRKNLLCSIFNVMAFELLKLKNDFLEKTVFQKQFSMINKQYDINSNFQCLGVLLIVDETSDIFGILRKF